MTHTTKVNIAPWQCKKIKTVQKKHAAEDALELHGLDKGAGEFGKILLKRIHEDNIMVANCKSNSNGLENGHLLLEQEDVKVKKLDKEQSSSTLQVSNPSALDVPGYKEGSILDNSVSPNVSIEVGMFGTSNEKAAAQSFPCGVDVDLSHLDNTASSSNRVTNAKDDLYISSSAVDEGNDPKLRGSDPDALMELEDNGRSNVVHGGAVWDIFRRQDVPKVIQYLEKHKKEFRHINNHPVDSVSAYCLLVIC